MVDLVGTTGRIFKRSSTVLWLRTPEQGVSVDSDWNQLSGYRTDGAVLQDVHIDVSAQTRNNSPFMLSYSYAIMIIDLPVRL